MSITCLSQDLGKLTGEVATVTASKLTSEIVTTRLPFPTGPVGCIGLHSSTDSLFKYVRRFDYFFTLLDARACKWQDNYHLIIEFKAIVL